MYNSGRRGRRASDGYGILSQADRFNQTEYPIPIVNSFAVTDGSYVPLDDTAVDTAGGQTIVLYGSGFAPGATVTVGGVTIGAVTYLDQGRLTFTSPVNSSGSYTIVVINANGGAGILVPGLVYSGVPTWSTSAGSIGSSYETTNVSSTFVATGDAPMTYSVLSGSLPPGTSLSTTGVLSGTAPVESGSTTYSFTIRATDGQLQDTDRSFSLTINTDVVTMSSPTNNQVISSFEYAPISNVTVAGTSAAGFGVVYSANTVPTGITLNANTGVISGTVNTVGNTFTRLTATANSTNRTATRDVVFNVNQDVVTWSSPADGTAYNLGGGAAISPVTLSATSAAGFGIQYSANALPSGLTLSGSTISGTPDTAQTVNTLLTATANTTNRSATRTISWSISLGDIYWKNVSLLLNANTPTPSFINDASLNNTQLTIVGDTRPNNFTPYEGGYYSNFFDGTGDYLNVTGPFSGTGPYTVEFWIYRTAAPGTTRILERGVTSTDFSIDMTNAGVMTVNTNAAVSGSTCTIAVALNVWTHVALVRTSTGANDTRWYINGVAAGAFTHSTSFGSGGTLQIGRAAAGTLLLTGYLSNLRVVMGSAVYTSAFTPVTTPLTPVANTKLLTCQSNNFIDNSANNNTITKSGDVTVSGFVPFPTPTTVRYNTQYSTYFNGSTDYLMTTLTGQSFGTGDFTIEGWTYNTTDVNNDGIFHLTASGFPGATTGLALAWFNSGGGFNLYYANGSQTNAGSVALNTWYHFAVVRISGTIKVYINGSLIISTGDTTNYTLTNLIIGGYYSTSYLMSGYISNFRVVKGVGVYTGAFTPPTSALSLTQSAGTNIAAITSGQTVLLTCQNNTLIDNSTNAFTITSVSGARPITISPFTQTTANTTVTTLGSTYFTSTSAYVTYAPGGSDTFGTGDFTVECWYNPTTTTAVNICFASSGTSSWDLLTYANQLYWHENAGNLGGAGYGNIPLNTWSHLAVCRSGTTLKMFINGMQVYSATNSYNYSAAPATRSIGAVNGGGAPVYISDFRIIKGTALYTSNFLPPQTALTAVANTTLLTLQTNGGATNNGFVDQSSFNNIITRNGNATQGTFSPYSPTGWSNYFDGTGDYLTVPNNAALQMGSGDFTIEFWIYYNSIASYQTPYSKGYTAAGDLLLQTGNGDGKIIVYLSGSAVITEASGAVVGQWYHYALVRSGTTVTLYRDGVSRGTTTSSVNFNTLDQAGIGATGKAPGGNSVGAFAVNGYMSNVRVVKGTAVYTGTFTPPTTPLSAIANTQLLTCQSNRLIDNSPNNFTITRNGDVSVQAISPFGGVTSVPTSYSNYFDGSGDYISIPTGSGQLDATGDFTTEMWVYWISMPTTGYQNICGQGNAGQNSYGLMVGATASDTWSAPYKFKLNIANTGDVLNGNTTLVAGQWYHLAHTRTSGVNRLFVNGVLQTNTYTDSTSRGFAGNAFTIGNNSNCFISNFRYIKGTSLYTTTFTPPTSRLTTIANTQLLTCQSDRMIDNSTNYFTITAVGDTKPRPFNPFGSTNTSQVVYSPAVNGGSIYLDGTGDNVLLNTIPKYGSSNHTIECWVLFNTVSSRQAILNSAWNTGSFATDGGWTLDMAGTNAGSLNFALGTMASGSFWIGPATGVGSFTVGQWYHIAIVRNGTTVTIYSNGVSIATGTLTASTTVMSNMGTLRIGAYDGGSFAFNGYISDVRVSSGALYTSNFTPPVAPLTPTVIIGANTFTAGALVNGTSGGIIDAHGSINLETVGDAKLAPEDAYSGSYYSVNIGGTPDTVSLPSATWTTFAGQFTCEMWLKFNNSSYSGNLFGVQNNGSLCLYYNVTSWNPNVYGSGDVFSTGWNPTPGVWYHIAITRNSSNLMSFWVNGTLSGSATTSASYTQGIYFMGDFGASSKNFNVSNFRVISNQCLFTGSFTPSTTPLTTTAVGHTGAGAASSITGTVNVLTCQSNKFVDNSSNNYTVTPGNSAKIKSINPFRQNTGKSILFDGTGDYLTTMGGNALSFGTGDYTVEFWVYFNNVSSTQTVIDGRPSGTASTSNQINIALVSGALNCYNNGGSPFIAGPTLVANQWYHYALSRVSGTTTLYLNGTRYGPATVDSGNYTTSTNRPTIGGDGNTVATGNLNGYISDLRITRGTARYTTNFTPPTTTFEVK